MPFYLDLKWPISIEYDIFILSACCLMHIAYRRLRCGSLNLKYSASAERERLVQRRPRWGFRAKPSYLGTAKCTMSFGTRDARLASAG